MSQAIRGTGEFNAEFDSRMEAVQKLKDELASEEEICFEVGKVCDWINGDPRIRRNLNARRFLEILACRHCCPNHEAWAKIEVMLRTREAQNSVARKNQIKEQRERKPIINADNQSEN